MPSATTHKEKTTEPTPIDLDRLDQLAAEARETIATLEPREAALSLDVLTDPGLADELRDAQERRGRAEAIVRQAELARQELERREAQRLADEEAARRSGGSGGQRPSGRARSGRRRGR